MAYHFHDYFWEGSGFDELHRYMKNGTDLCKDFESVLSDRSELENVYVKGMTKILKKAKTSSKRCMGTMETAWGKMISLLEAECEAHRTLGAELSTDCSKVLKSFTEQQIKQREPLESAVDKNHKYYVDKQSKQMKNKRTAFKSCRDLETSWEQLKEVKATRSGTEKDAHKLEKSCRKIEEALMKADRDYRESNMKTEHSRLSWESVMYQCCKNNEVLEQERLQQMQAMFNHYSELLEGSIPPIQTACQDLVDSAGGISPEMDLEFACGTYGTGPNQPEQTLFDCYEEDMKNSMDSERRLMSLERKIQHIETEIVIQEKAKAGVEQLSRVYQDQPDFVDEKGADNVNRQLVEANCILNLLKANHYKLLCAHAETSDSPRPCSHFSEYISSTSDKHGHTVSLLRIPLEQISYMQDDYQPANYEHSSSREGGRNNKKTSQSMASNGRERDEWDDDPTEDGYPEDGYNDQAFDPDGGYNYVGECNVLYAYQANETDELSINPGDVIKIIDKYDTEWWQGELNGSVGIFPASYVEDA